MRYTVTKQRLQVLGRIWWPYGATAAIERDLTSYDLENLGDPRNREEVAAWIDTNCGDFSGVIDFRADFHLAPVGWPAALGDEDVVHEWRNAENELAYSDCMYPGEE